MTTKTITAWANNLLLSPTESIPEGTVLDIVEEHKRWSRVLGETIVASVDVVYNGVAINIQLTD
ncbi:hypothetical protein VPHK356_0110 [Vibrio phage K356]|nr:hypothetical protein MYOV002v2_p0102 [Vibrio phage 144E46.1]